MYCTSVLYGTLFVRCTNEYCTRRMCASAALREPTRPRAHHSRVHSTPTRTAPLLRKGSRNLSDGDRSAPYARDRRPHHHLSVRAALRVQRHVQHFPCGEIRRDI